MGKKIDALLGRKFKTSKFKATVNLATSRLSILKNQRHARLSIARSDLTQLLNQGHHERALLRVDQVIKEQNMLDVFEMIDSYCLLLLERVNLIEQEKVCPDELNEAASSLIYASTRCGEFPELQEIRAVLTSRFGKEFAARAIELRNNCGVNTKMITKLSTRQSGLETRLKMLKEIASENGIVLQIEDLSSSTEEEKVGVDQKQNMPQTDTRMNLGETKTEDDYSIFTKEMEEVVSFSELMKGRKYRDAADAAQAAFESAAYAAAAARAAVELSRIESFDPDDQDGDEHMRSKPQNEGKEEMEVKELNTQLRYEKIHPKNDDIESDDEAIDIGNKNGARIIRSVSVSNSDSDSDSDGNNIEGTLQSSDVEEHVKKLEKDLVFDESDNEKYEQPRIKSPKTHAIGSEKFNTVNDEGMFGASVKIPSQSQKPISVRTRRLFGR